MKKSPVLFFAIVSLAFFACGEDSVPNCCDSAPVFERFGDATLFLPNVFTPNADGVNDVFRADGGNLKSVRLTVKSGIVKVFETTSAAQGWSGKLANGSDAADGRYDVEWDAVSANGQARSGSFKLCLQRDGKLSNCSDCAFPAQFDGNSYDPDLPNQEAICD